jgi:hypothetical protein
MVSVGELVAKLQGPEVYHSISVGEDIGKHCVVHTLPSEAIDERIATDSHTVTQAATIEVAHLISFTGQHVGIARH